jgi:hypothetical protein
MEPTSSQFPISHVKVRPQSAWSDDVRHMKLDAFGKTDEMRMEDSAIKESYAKHGDMFDKKPTVKINSGAKINGEDY